MSTIDRVHEFHRIFGHPIAEAPLMPDVSRIKLRVNLILEEGGVELIQALGGAHEGNVHLQRAVELIQRAKDQVNMAPDYEFRNADIVAVADALGDNDYVTAGAALEFGIPLEEVGEEIHESNMTKLDENGEPIYNEHGKVMKGPQYRAPDIAGVMGIAQPEPEEDSA